MPIKQTGSQEKPEGILTDEYSIQRVLASLELVAASHQGSFPRNSKAEAARLSRNYSKRLNWIYAFGTARTSCQ